MERFIGLDAHSQTCTLAVMGPTGRRLKEQTLETQGKLLVDFVRSVPGRRRLCLEEGSLSEWLCEILAPHVDELVVVQPPKRSGAKNDSIDAWQRASDLRIGNIDGAIFKPQGRFSMLREAVRAHRLTTEDMVRAKIRLNALFRSRGILVNDEIYDPDGRAPWLAKLPAARRKLAELLSIEVDQLTELRATAEHWLHEEGQKHKEVRRLQTAPGIGPVRAAYIVAVVVTPFRFATKREYFSYCGLGIVTRSSSDYEQDPRTKRWVRRAITQTRGLNRNRHPLLKVVYKGAALHVVSLRRHPLHHDYQRLIQTVKPPLARLTIARRIASATLAMWKKQEEYDPNKHCAKDRK